MQDFNTNQTANAVQSVFGSKGEVAIFKPFHEVPDPRKAKGLSDIVRDYLALPEISTAIMPYYEGSPTGKKDWDKLRAADIVLAHDKANGNRFQTIVGFNEAKLSAAIGVVMRSKYAFDPKTGKIIGYSKKVVDLSAVQ